MAKPGRLALVTSVLSAIPVHQLLVLAPDKKTIKAADKIRRGFLWAAKDCATGGQCHVNWATVCRPLRYGGLGVQDLERAGTALRLRWMWLESTDQTKPWAGLDLQFSTKERQMFFASTFMTIGDGNTAKFWTDRWIDGQAITEIAPAVAELVSKRTRRAVTVSQGLQNNDWSRTLQGRLNGEALLQFLLLWPRITRFRLGTEPDRLVWRWTVDGVYSAKSCYLASFQGSIISNTWELTWKTWAPRKVKFHFWKANLDRCWTADRLQRRGLPHEPRCVLCDQSLETMQHLIIDCPFVQQIWFEVLSWLRSTYPPPQHGTHIGDWWLRAKQATPKQLRKGLASMTLLNVWMIWKLRNECTFNIAQPNIASILNRIKAEARLWARAGAIGLRVYLPETWDVH
jgi:hypothetical protein